jgi:hypothetical protein
MSHDVARSQNDFRQIAVSIVDDLGSYGFHLNFLRFRCKLHGFFHHLAANGRLAIVERLSIKAFNGRQTCNRA